VVVEKETAPGTQVIWIVGTLVAVLWPVGVFLAPAYAYHWPAYPDFLDSWVVQVIGVILSVAGGVLFTSAARALGRQMTPVIRVQQGHQLVQEGLFRYIRHPVYTAIIMVATGQTLFFLSLPVGLLTLVLVGLASYRARLEEDLLKSPQAFGGAYESYAARTGRFLPRLRSGP
jgi:protein-S-isoprenylcysteine O-methyltransferase Ste14